MTKIIPVVFCFFFILVNVVGAEPEIKETVQYYKINGQTADELRQEMVTKGMAPSGESFDGRTQWKIDWKFKLDDSRAGCGIRSIKTLIESISAMPEWTGQEEGELYLQIQWEDYLNAVIEHDLGHREIILKTAMEIEDRLGMLEKFPSCSEAEETANQTAENVFNYFKDKQHYYDEKTNHGKKQGATFP